LICTEKDNCDEVKSTIRKVGEATGCELCSNNGRCELQDVVDALKVDKVSFPSLYRNLDVKRKDPFFDRNNNLCILCGRCVRICREVRGASTLSFAYRGSEAVISTSLDKPLIESGCQFCGACVDVCPTGALAEKAVKYESLPNEKAQTICPLCSIGCKIEVGMKEGRIIQTKPEEKGPVNKGQACVKGRFVLRDIEENPARVLSPLIRKKKDLEEVSWDEALDYVSKNLKKFKGDEIACIPSAQENLEDNYVFHKFARDALKTRNIFSFSQYSSLSEMSRFVKDNGLKFRFNFNIEDISHAKAIFLFGGDITVSHPVLWLEVLKAVRNGAKLVIASPVEYSYVKYASIWLRINPGSEMALFAGLSKLFCERNGCGSSKISGLDDYKKSLEEFVTADIVDETGIEENDLKNVVSILADEEQSVFLLGNGLFQSGSGLQNKGFLWNLALITEARLIPLGNENNLRGMIEIDRQFDQSRTSGSREFFQGLSEGRIKALYLEGRAGFPKKANVDFMVIQDSFLNEISASADAILPVTTFAEEEGTFVNTEGRIQTYEPAVESLGEAKPGWWIISQLALRMKFPDYVFKNPSGVRSEIFQKISGFTKASYSNLKKGSDVFVKEEGKASRHCLPVSYTPSLSQTDNKYPFLLCLEYGLDHYRNLFLNRENKGLRRIRNSNWARLSEIDAAKLKVSDGDEVILNSAHGKIKRIVKISGAVPQGLAVITFVWGEGSEYPAELMLIPYFMETHALNLIPVKIKRGN
jgi:predicted molibdopterin-dependent oxidoreductase YjgC